MSRLILALPLLALLACGAGPVGGPRLAIVAPLSSPRATHALVRTAGHALLIGGCVRDGCEAGPGSATVDVIGLADDRRTIGRLATARVQPGAVWLGGERALVAGGWVDGRVDAGTEVFDAATGRSRPGPAMAHPRSSAALARLADGRVLIAGGWDGARPLAAAEVYDPAMNRLTRVGDLRQARSGATATLLGDGRVLIAGGGTGDGGDRRALASAELFDPATGRFATTGALALRRYKHSAVALADGTVLIVGGSDERDYGGKAATVERYDPATGRCRAAGRLAEARFKLADASVLLPSGKVLVAGGSERPELFDPATGRSALLPVDLGGRWNYLTATRAGSGVLLAGGYRKGSIRVSDRVWRLAL